MVSLDTIKGHKWFNPFSWYNMKYKRTLTLVAMLFMMLLLRSQSSVCSNTSSNPNEITSKLDTTNLWA